MASCSKKQEYSVDPPLVPKEDRINWIKDYAFVRCVSVQYGQDLSSEFFRNDYSASALVDISNMWGKVDEVDSLAQVFVSSYQVSPIQDYEGMRPIMMSCLAFWRSNQLDQYAEDVFLNIRY
jgi:hypothetical protein